MKKLLTILILLGLVAAIGYILGTENGRARRDELLLRLKGAPDTGPHAAETDLDITIETTEDTASTAEAAI